MLDFENELRPLEAQLERARHRSNGNGASAEEMRLSGALHERLRSVYQQLSPWQKVQVARHRERPYTL
ncbi:MAG: acetyl-CoA carboxylase carboxyltransferase subunit alpha, partial [Chloroflexota bacterium]